MVVMRWHFSRQLLVANQDKSKQRRVLILEESFDPLILQAQYQQESMSGKTDYGATANFIGTMRDINEGDDIHSMVLEHYPSMTEKQLNELLDEAFDQWPIQNALIAHRVGEIFPAQPIVLVTVWSAHRGAAFDACRFIMEALKHRAPFWKKESLAGGSTRWVAENTKG